MKLRNQRLDDASTTIGCKKLPHKVLFCFKELIYIPPCSFLTYNIYYTHLENVNSCRNISIYDMYTDILSSSPCTDKGQINSGIYMC